MRQETLSPSLRVRRSEIFAQNIEDRGKVRSAAVRLGKQRAGEAADHARIAGAVPPVRQATSSEAAVDLFNGAAGVLHGQALVGLESPVRIETRGRQMQFIVPGMGQQLTGAVSNAWNALAR